MGVMWGLISVAIASLAQLSLGFAMMRLSTGVYFRAGRS